MTMHGARQMRGQCLTTGTSARWPHAGFARTKLWIERVDLGLKGGDIGADGLIKQVPMHRVDGLRGLTKAHATQMRELEHEHEHERLCF